LEVGILITGSRPPAFALSAKAIKFFFVDQEFRRAFNSTDGFSDFAHHLRVLPNKQTSVSQVLGMYANRKHSLQRQNGSA